MKRWLHVLTILHRNWQRPSLLHSCQRHVLFKNNLFKNWFKNNFLNRETLDETNKKLDWSDSFLILEDVNNSW